MIMRLPVVLLLLAGAASLSAAYTVGWSATLPGAPDIVTPTSVLAESAERSVYVMTGVEFIVALNATNGAVLWQAVADINRLANLAVSRGDGPLERNLVYASSSINSNGIVVCNLVSGSLVWQSNLSTGLVVDYLAATADEVQVETFSANGLQKNASYFGLQSGRLRWVQQEPIFAQKAPSLGQGVVITVNIAAPVMPKPTSTNLFVVQATNALNGDAMWNASVTAVVADGADDLQTTTTAGAIVRSRRAVAAPPRFATPAGTIRQLIAVLNVTAIKSPFDFNASVLLLSRVLGFPLAAVPLPPNVMGTIGAFTSAGKLIVTDGLAALLSIDVATATVEWRASLWTDPSFHPFADVVVEIVDAGKHVLVNGQAQGSPSNISTPTPVNITAFDAKTGARLGTLSFPDTNQFILPLFDGRAMVVPFSIAPAGFLVYDLVTGALLRNETNAPVFYGSVQLVRPGVVIAAFANDTVSELHL